MAIHSWLHPLHTLYVQWMHRRMPAQEKTTLQRQRILIFATREGWIFGILLLALLLGTVNYQLSLGYALTFLLASIGVVGILHTYRNLYGLRLEINKVEPVFAGERVLFEIAISSNRNHDAICIEFTPEIHKIINVVAQEPTLVQVAIPTHERGWFKLNRFLVYTTLPLGIMRAWSFVDLQAVWVVYPKPSADHLWHEASDALLPTAITSMSLLPEDFTGLRTYQQGDSFKHIAWKTYAEGHGLYSKQFAGLMSPEIWLEWQQFAHLPDETILSCLCRAVLEAEAAHLAYGMRIPGMVIQPAQGDWHMHHCLRVLALYGKESPW